MKTVNTADQLLDLHEESGLSWPEIARALGVSTRQVACWAIGSRIRNLSTLESLDQLSTTVQSLDAHSPAQVREQLMARHGDNPSIFDQLRQRNTDSADRMHYAPLLPGS